MDAGHLIGDRVDREGMRFALVIGGIADVDPLAALEDLECCEICLIAHFARAGHPIAKIDIGQPHAARDLDMIEDQIGAQAVLDPIGLVALLSR